MARSSTTVSYARRQEQYVWPEFILNVWVIIMLATGGLLIGVFATFINIQNHFRVPIPWLFPFGIIVGALTILYVILIMILIARRALLPFLILIFSFILFALYLTGVIETAIQLFQSSSNVNASCQNYIIGQPVYGEPLPTLAWLEQNSICQSWYAAFAFWIIGAVFFVWIFVIGVTVAGNTGGAYLD